MTSEANNRENYPLNSVTGTQDQSNKSEKLMVDGNRVLPLRGSIFQWTKLTWATHTLTAETGPVPD